MIDVVNWWPFTLIGTQEVALSFKKVGDPDQNYQLSHSQILLFVFSTI